MKAYPLFDLPSLKLACGLDPLEAINERSAGETAHHPLHDARCSARDLVHCLRLNLYAE